MSTKTPPPPLTIGKIILGMLFTFMFGPGAGHLYLRQFSTGLLLIAITLVSSLSYAMRVLKAYSPELLDAQKALALMQQFAASHQTTMFYFDVVFAGVWAFAFYDIYRIAKDAGITVFKKDSSDDSSNNAGSGF